MGKVVTHLQVKNKWDHLRKLWKQYNECFDNETGLGIDAGIGMLEASDEWWTRKIAISSLYIVVKTLLSTTILCSNYWLSSMSQCKNLKKNGFPNRNSMDIMFGGTVATGKNVFCMSG